MNYVYTLTLLMFCLLLNCAQAESYNYEGTWVTVKGKKLDGRMTAVVTPMGDEWSGRFFGIWQGVKFDYTVKFAGKFEALIGKATIDGAKYDWRGSIDLDSFKGSFTGDRYHGSFDLRRKK